jgi:formamidopyrimidine-DNA glycosylase
MTGSFLVHDEPLTDAERRYAVLTAAIGDGATLVYRDVRRLGTILLLDEKRWTAYSGRIGPEPLDDEFDVDAFVRILSTSRQAIKKVIMDQRKLAGVGNIYANEALFKARIDPSLPAHRVTHEAATRLHRAIRTILTQAINSQGTTFRDYRRGTGERGSFQFRLHVYGREGKPCRRCGSILAVTHAIDARSTTFCWRCQGVTS